MQNLKETIASHDNNYNLIRLVLASSVIFYHAFLLAGSTGYDDIIDAAFLKHGASLGNWAVGCFFFLSGLFVAQSFHRDGSAINFFIRRFCRLWPGLMACLFVTAIIACILSQGSKALYYVFDPDFYHYIVHNAIFLSIWVIPGVFDGRADSGINGSIHTLPTEVKMYFLLLVSGCLLPFKKMRSIGLTALVLLIAGIFFFHLMGRRLDLTPSAQLLTLLFFSGVMAFTFASYIKPYPMIGLLALALTLMTPAPWNTVFFFTTSVWIMIFVGQLKQCWSPKSDISYGIYIYGWPSQQFVTSFWPGLNPYLHSVLALLLAALFAFISWRVIENPAMNCGRTLIAALARYRETGARPKLLEIKAWQPVVAMLLVFILCDAGKRITRHYDFNPVQALDLHIISFGPTGTNPGKTFNKQADGSSALWITLDAVPPRDVKIIFDGISLDTALDEHSATAKVPQNLYAQKGDKQIVLEIRRPGLTERTSPVIFHVVE